jgi:hypothetical protein
MIRRRKKMSWTPYDRDKPKPFIEKAIELFTQRGGKVILEIGNMRMRLNHPIEENHHKCCCDGHSSVFFARTGCEFYSVDNDYWACEITKEYTKDWPKTRVLCKDGIKFLKNFGKKLDLLFLDGWDVDHPDTAQLHLEAFKIASRVLHEKSIVLIDDTDVDFIDNELRPTKELYGGKGRLVVPTAMNEGWKVIMEGRCTLLSKV